MTDCETDNIQKATESPLRPNMVVVKADATSSTFCKVNSSHSIIHETSYFNCRFNRANFEGSAFSGCDIDGAVYENCSLRGVEFVNCDIDGLIINGVNVGDLFKMFVRG
ncbi:pentapeptide repeat-containing protein [Leptothoe spongobia]|uniref:Pentapeptide repeat-containing protein n=1 Tax=Leptothoe spongobia TAU-MAC 1115 TaxID=1967444 RepID=A0A947DKT7_9CYAN|nr:pentapeptide repeat-containing protein [Leptothoe spongobia]MBT9317729.1 pentapeptide repeat-containing protein [Leptothoe spongobia TAU-MAC 1115]